MSDNELLLAISNMIEPIKQDIQDLKQDMQSIKHDVQDIKGRVQRIEMTQENDILPRLQNIESCYTSTYERYKVSVEDYESIKQDIALLKKVVTEHSDKLRKIS